MKGELRRRLLRIDTPSAIDRPIRRALLIQAATTIALVFLDRSLSGNGDLSYALIAFALAWTGGFLQIQIRRHLGPMGLLIDGILVACAFVPLALMRADIASFGFALPLVIAAIFVRNTRSDSSAIACAGLLILAAATMAMRIPERLSPFLALPALAIGLTVAIWVHARAARRRLQRRAIRDSSEEDGWGLQTRALLACSLALLLFLMTQFSLRSSEWGMQRWRSYSDSREEVRLRETLDRMHAPSTQAEHGPGAGGGTGLRSAQDAPQEQETSLTHEDVRQGKQGASYFDDELGLTGSLIEAPRSRRVELRVISPRAKERHFSVARPAYLMTTSYSGFTPDGLGAASRMPRYAYTDSGDGVRDGWTQIQDDPYYGTYLEIEVRCRNLIAPTSGELRHIVPRIEPLIAIRQAAVQRQADGMLTLPDLGEFEHISRMRCRASSTDLLNAQGIQFDRSDASSLSLPTNKPAWDPVMAEIREQVKQLDASEPVLRAVLGHFRRSFRYSLAVPDRGTRGLAEFLKAREGYCIYFATSAMLMLRELGVPCRVASGYRISRWDNELDAYVAGDQGAHAWVEVHVAGQGWVPLDPTPSLGLQEVTAAEMSRLEQLEILAELEGMDDVRAAEIAAAAAREDAARESSNPSGIPQAESPATQAASPPAEPHTKRLSYSGILIGAIVAALAILIFMARDSLLALGHKTWSPIDDRDIAGLHDYHAIVYELARLGVHPRRGQTPLEFAHQVALHVHYPFPAMVPVVWSLYAHHFGRFELTATDQVRIDQLREAISRAD